MLFKDAFYKFQTEIFSVIKVHCKIRFQCGAISKLSAKNLNKTILNSNFNKVLSKFRKDQTILLTVQNEIKRCSPETAILDWWQ